jgi:hypothetical protein
MSSKKLSLKVRIPPPVGVPTKRFTQNNFGNNTSFYSRSMYLVIITDVWNNADKKIPLPKA